MNGRFQGVGGGGYAGGAVTQTRPICLYPEVAAYKGRGDVAAASSFGCRRSR
jgi:hypothetical protein